MKSALQRMWKSIARRRRARNKTPLWKARGGLRQGLFLEPLEDRRLLAMFTITTPGQSGVEGPSGSVGTTTVMRSAPANVPTSATITVGGTASSSEYGLSVGSTYHAAPPASVVVEFPVGVVAVPIGVSPAEDGISEMPEDVTLTITSIEAEEGDTFEPTPVPVMVYDNYSDQPRCGPCTPTLFTGAHTMDLPIGAGAGLYYASNTVPHPIVTVEGTLPAGKPAPSALRATLTMNSYANPVRNYTDMTGIGAGDAFRVAVQHGLSQTLPTGRYAWTMSVLVEYPGTSPADDTLTFSGHEFVVNNSLSPSAPYGKGYWPAGLDRLMNFAGYYGRGIIKGDGTPIWYEPTTIANQWKAAGDPDGTVLTYDPGTTKYTLTYKTGE